MRIRLLSKLATVAFVIALLSTADIYAQKWSGENGNEWIVEGREYAIIKIRSKGIHRVNISSLPAGFPTSFDPDYLQLWYRGKQVAILKATASEIEFYGEPNDGKFDELLCRPDPNRPSITGRMNKFVSLFSEYSFYYLTVGGEKGLRALQTNTDLLTATGTETYHVKTDTIKYVNEFNTSGTFSTYPAFFNSFYDFGQTFTGARQTRISAAVVQPFKISNLNTSTGLPVKAKVLLHNRGKTNCKVEISIRAAGGTYRVVNVVTIPEFKAFEYEFDLDIETDATAEKDIDGNGNGDISFIVKDGVTGNFYSVSYITFTYPQDLTAENNKIKVFHLPAASATASSTMTITGLPAGPYNFLDISNTQEPVILTTTTPAALKVPRVNGQKLDILHCTSVNTVTGANISRFTGLSKTYSNYQDKDYIIITTENLKVAAVEYANYRATTFNKLTKGNFKPLVLTVEDIYKQYNFGEPSAVGIRRCLDFLLTDNNFNKHVFLIGNSNNLNKGVMELPDQVPTVGYPGSDFLLVSGLRGTNQDFQTVAVGRLPVGTLTKLRDYLAKVKQYEDYSDLSGLSWRKKVIHYAGGKRAIEVSDLHDALTDAANDYAIPSGATISTFKKGTTDAEACPPNHDGFVDCQTFAPLAINDKLNEGAGIITYYGHGSPRITDYFAGYATDASRNINNAGKYPGYFLYGCDVNNVFAGFNENVSYDLGDFTRRAFTLDWLLTPNKGAITVVGNSWEGYESILTPLLRKTYAKLFVADKDRDMLGDIMKKVTNETLSILPGYGARVTAIAPDVSAYNYNFTQANMHQTVLLGDPAINLMLQVPPTALPVTWASISAKLVDPSKVLIQWKTASETNNEKFLIERSQDGKIFKIIAAVDGKGDSDFENAYSFYDLNPLYGKSYYRVSQVDKGENNNVGSSSRIVTVDNTVDDLILVYPNPSPGLMKISSSRIDVDSWSLVDVQGRVMIPERKGDNVDLSNVSGGIYFLKIKTNGGEVVTKKIVRVDN
jgi:hypothetical protein